MKKWSLLVPTCLFCFAYSGIASAERFTTCERITANTRGFTSVAAFRSWFPSPAFFELSAAKAIENRSFVQFESGFYQAGAEYFLYPPHKVTLFKNGSMSVEMTQKAGYQRKDPVRYKCDMNSEEVKELIKASARSTSSNNGIASKPSNGMGNGSLNLNEAKKECASLGFQTGTEKFGDCVMKLLP